MEIFSTADELRQWSRKIRLNSCNTVGLVPTMGALHQGHASLIRAAVASCTHVAVSIFVNPTQFGPNEDFSRYPRTFDADCALAAANGATAIYAPDVQDLYPQGASTFVDVEEPQQSSRRPFAPRSFSRSRHSGHQAAHRRRS